MILLKCSKFVIFSLSQEADAAALVRDPDPRGRDHEAARRARGGEEQEEEPRGEGAAGAASAQRDLPKRGHFRPISHGPNLGQVDRVII